MFDDIADWLSLKPAAMSAQTGTEELDENKIDFDLLKQRQQQQQQQHEASQGLSSASTIPSGNSSALNEVWPLHLTTTFIDHYITGNLIGSGSYAEVRECVNTRTLERCALKIINKEYLVRQAPRALANQMQEIRLLRRFQHPNIIKMRECLHKGFHIYIVLEYCSFNLNELLNDQPNNKLHVVIARRFFHQLCNGLQYLHSLGIVHRDIKPDNLLLTNSGILKIIDFGVSHILTMWNRNDLCSNYEGTPLFQAPEVIVGQSEYHGFKVDVWSCGITLFRLLFGTYPFVDEALLGLYDKILSQDLVVPPCGPTTRALRHLLTMMLAKESAKRASIDQVLEHNWLKLCHANLHDSDNSDLSDFFELVTRSSDTRRTAAFRDDYRSMSVLPYLYRHHFPDLPPKKSRRYMSSSHGTSLESLLNNKGVKVERINSFSSPPTPVATDESVMSTTSTTSTKSTRSTRSTIASTGSRRSNGEQEAKPATTQRIDDPDETLDSSNEFVRSDTNKVEWGTEEQYQLMKLPKVRANRVRQPTPSTGRRRRRRRKRNRQARSDSSSAGRSL